MAIPFLLWEFHALDILCLYIANIDLLATSLSYNSGPYKTEIFAELYSDASATIYSYFSRIIINTIALLGVLYTVGIVQKKSKSIIKGCIVGAIVIVVTFLAPNDIISTVQSTTAEVIKKYTGQTASTSFLTYLVVTIMGLIIGSIYFV